MPGFAEYNALRKIAAKISVGGPTFDHMEKNSWSVIEKRLYLEKQQGIRPSKRVLRG